MNELITVEDYNTAFLNYKDPFLYLIDVSLLNLNGAEIKKWKYDFLTITKTSNTLELVIINELWNGEFYMLDENESIVQIGCSFICNYDPSDRSYTLSITFTGNHSNLKYIGLILCQDEYKGVGDYGVNNKYKVTLEKRTFFIKEKRQYSFIIESVDYATFNHIDYCKLTLSTTDGEEINLTEYELTQLDETHYNVIFEYTPTKKLTDVLKLKVNHYLGNIFSFRQKEFKKPNPIKLKFNDNTLYNLPTGTLLIGNKTINSITIYFAYYTPKITIRYGDKEIIKYPSINSKYVQVTVDLLDKTDLSSVKLEVEFEGTLDTIDEKYVFNIPVGICGVSPTGTIGFSPAIRIYKIQRDGTLDSNVTRSDDLIVYGDNHTLDLHTLRGLTVDGGSVKFYDTIFTNANQLFYLKEGSNIECYNCTFINCNELTYEGYGGVCYCETNIDNIHKEGDFTLTFKGCTFRNCNGAIFNGGSLRFEDCKFLIDDATIINGTAPAFLYQVDGSAYINNNVFDIDIDDNYLCENEINAKLSQALIVCGENAVINNATSKDLMNDDALPLFEVPYRNKSHIFMKYYYDEIEDCVYVSPIPNREDKSVCYAVSNVDWIFKQNVQITKANWGTENDINPISW